MSINIIILWCPNENVDSSVPHYHITPKLFCWPNPTSLAVHAYEYSTSPIHLFGVMDCRCGIPIFPQNSSVGPIQLAGVARYEYSTSSIHPHRQSKHQMEKDLNPQPHTHNHPLTPANQLCFCLNKCYIYNYKLIRINLV